MFALWMVLACTGLPRRPWTLGPRAQRISTEVPPSANPSHESSSTKSLPAATRTLAHRRRRTWRRHRPDRDGTYSLLKYQIGSDPYITTEAVDCRMLYLPGESSYSIPWAVADGRYEFHPNEMDDGEPYAADDFQTLSEQPAYLQVSVRASTTDQTMTVDVELWPTRDISGEDLRLFVAIKENTTENNVGSNGQTEFKAS